MSTEEEVTKQAEQGTPLSSTSPVPPKEPFEIPKIATPAARAPTNLPPRGALPPQAQAAMLQIEQLLNKKIGDNPFSPEQQVRLKQMEFYEREVQRQHELLKEIVRQGDEDAKWKEVWHELSDELVDLYAAIEALMPYEKKEPEPKIETTSIADAAPAAPAS